VVVMAMIVMIVMIVVIVVIVMVIVVVIVMIVMVIVVVIVVGVMAVAVPVSVPVHLLQEAHRVQKGHPKGEKEELGQPKPEGGLLVQNVRQNVDRGQVHKSPRGDPDQALSRESRRQESHRGADHGGKGGPELRHDGVLFAEPVLDEDGKIPELVGYLVEQYGERRQTAPRFQNVQHAGAARKIGKGGSDRHAVRELEKEEEQCKRQESGCGGLKFSTVDVGQCNWKHIKWPLPTRWIARDPSTPR